jgi:hypothetical protein
MKKALLVAGFALCLMIPVSSIAGTYHLTEDIILHLAIQDGWTLHIESPPELLVRDIASHIAHEPAADSLTEEQIMQVAKKRLKANEGILYHEKSGAHLDLDFSKIPEGETQPRDHSLKTSAEYAGQSLSNEKDISETVWEVSPSYIRGLDRVYRLSARYNRHDQAFVFWGYIGAIKNHWVYLYFTAPVNQLDAISEMKVMFDEMSFEIK